ncbi:MAG: dockerin type I domain-containing protein [bacterium]
MKYRILFLSALAVLMFSGIAFAGIDYAGSQDVVVIGKRVNYQSSYDIDTGALYNPLGRAVLNAGVPYTYRTSSSYAPITGLSMPSNYDDPQQGWLLAGNYATGLTPLSNYNVHDNAVENQPVGEQLIDIESRYLVLGIDHDWEMSTNELGNSYSKAFFVDQYQLIRLKSDGCVKYNSYSRLLIHEEARVLSPQSAVWPAGGSNTAAYADVQIVGQDAYWTLGKDSGNARLFKINKNFTGGGFVEANNSYAAYGSLTPTLVLDATAMGVTGATEARGFTLDSQDNIYMIINSSTVAMFDPTGTTCLNAAFITGSSAGEGVTDIDYVNNKLVLATGAGVGVYDLSGGLLRTLESGVGITGIDVVAGVPTTVDFVCTVTLEDWNGTSLPTVTVTVDSGTPVVKTLTGSGSSGSFTLSLAPGEHTIKVKAAKSLSQTVTGAGTTPSFMLQCGDTNDDNKIDDLDFLSVIGNFGSTDPVLKLIGDGNGDGKTDDLDFLNVIGKFATSGT